MNIEAVIFDKDGVLVDSERLKADAWELTLKRYGVEGGFSWYLQNLGPSEVALAAAAIESFAFQATPRDVGEEWKATYRSLAGGVQPADSGLAGTVCQMTL